MKKKICSILLAAALALTVTACGSSGGSTDGSTQAVTTSSESKTDKDTLVILGAENWQASHGNEQYRQMTLFDIGMKA